MALMGAADKKKAGRVTEGLLRMKKRDVVRLQKT
jgi:hypothetical protein